MVHVSWGNGKTANVEVKLFTAAFRRVLRVSAVLGDGTFDVILADERGTPLAPGLYYLTVRVGGEKALWRLVVLR